MTSVPAGHIILTLTQPVARCKGQAFTDCRNFVTSQKHLTSIVSLGNILTTSPEAKVVV